MQTLGSAPGYESPRNARPEDMPAILETVNQVMRVANNKAPTIATDWPHIYRDANANNILIITDKGKVAASVATWLNDVAMGDATLKVGGINCLAVLPEYRRHGFGTLLMEAAHRHMKDVGCHVGILSTSIVAWYRKLGWDLAGVGVTFHLNRSNIHLLPAPGPDFLWRVAGEEALDDVVRLRNADRLGGLREIETLRPLWTARCKRKIILAEHQGKPVAYMVADERRTTEWGGPAEFLLPLVRAWFESTDNAQTSTSQRDAGFKAVIREEFSVSAASGGHPFIDQLEQLRLPLSIGYLGMMRVINPQATLDAFGVTDIRAEEDGDRITLRPTTAGSGQSRTFTRAQAAKVFFGPEKMSRFGEDVFPLAFYQWQVEHV